MTKSLSICAALPSNERITDTQLRILIGDIEAWKPSQMSITQKWQLSAFRELRERRAAPGPQADEIHVANEWADMASNGIQWLRNIREGVSGPIEALREMTSNYVRIMHLKEEITQDKSVQMKEGG